MLKIRHLCLISVITGCLLLQSCAGLLIGAGLGAASVVHDRRTVGTQLDDKTTAAKISSAFYDDESFNEQTRVSIQVFNGTVLLVGQAPTQSLIKQAETITRTVENIKKVHNQIRLGAPIPASVIANDTWLASKVKAKLLADSRIDGLHVEVEIENGEVFLMGLATEQEANAAVDVARNITGVKQVIKAFEYL